MWAACYIKTINFNSVHFFSDPNETPVVPLQRKGRLLMNTPTNRTLFLRAQVIPMVRKGIYIGGELF